AHLALPSLFHYHDPHHNLPSFPTRRSSDLYVSGSGTLVRAMLADGLVDELHLFVYPLTLGSGPRLFAEGATPMKASLPACESYENGVVYLAYRPTARSVSADSSSAG